MCGIAFILSKKNSKISDDLNKHFIKYLYDRGPNNQNFYSEKNFSLISTRLSVIDTDEVHQCWDCDSEGEFYETIEDNDLIDDGDNFDKLH